MDASPLPNCSPTFQSRFTRLMPVGCMPLKSRLLLTERALTGGGVGVCPTETPALQGLFCSYGGHVTQSDQRDEKNKKSMGVISGEGTASLIQEALILPSPPLPSLSLPSCLAGWQTTCGQAACTRSHRLTSLTLGAPCLGGRSRDRTQGPGSISQLQHLPRSPIWGLLVT